MSAPFSTSEAAVNDPKTNIWITDKDQIKEVSLAHNVEILTKMKPLPRYEYIIKEKQESHEKMMERNQEEDKWILDISFYGKVTKSEQHAIYSYEMLES